MNSTHNKVSREPVSICSSRRDFVPYRKCYVSCTVSAGGIAFVLFQEPHFCTSCTHEQTSNQVGNPRDIGGGTKPRSYYQCAIEMAG